MNADSVDVFALHGFLGVREDWKITFDFLKQEKPHWNLHAENIFEYSAKSSMNEWAKAFNARVKQSNPNSKKIFLGYSMGGRLGLHAIANDPQLWSGAVFLSTNPGLHENSEKLSRVENDKKWADRFSNEEFHQVLMDWNAQPVFKGSKEPSRKVEFLDKQHIVHALTAWSLGLQKDFREHIDLWSIRQIWAAGEKDSKFVEILTTLPVSNEMQKWVVEDASHRLLFEAPQEVAHFVARVGSPIISA